MTGKPRARVLLIGLDGATFSVLDPLMAAGTMPFLRDLVAGGVRAPLRTVIPALTPPGWTSLVTGKRPGQHGVFDFFRREAPDSQYFRFASSQDIGAATIWSVASEHGQRIVALNFPLMFPPPAVHGAVVPGGWMPWRQLRLGCYPPGLFDRLKELPSFNARELALDMALEEKAIEGCDPTEYAEWIALHIRRERRWFDILRYLLEEEPSDLAAVLFDGVDKLQHLCWRFLDPGARQSPPVSAWEQEIRDLCDAYFRQLDELIAETVALAGPGATVILASDHGAGPTTDVFHVNTWLEQHGYLAWAENGHAQLARATQLGFGNMARHVYQLDWDRTVAYAATPSSNGIFLVTRTSDEGGPGIAAADYNRVRAEIAAGLRSIRHPITGEPIVVEVWTREEAFEGPHAALAPDLTVTLADGGLVSIMRSAEVVVPRAEPAGAHRAEGVFLASGPGLQAGLSLEELSIVDVAPLVLYQLGIPIPDDLAGRVPMKALEVGEAQRRPIQLRLVHAEAASGAPTPEHSNGHDPGVLYDAEAEATMLKRLRALGYVE